MVQRAVGYQMRNCLDEKTLLQSEVTGSEDVKSQGSRGPGVVGRERSTCGQTGGEAGSPLLREALEKVTDSGVRHVD